MNNSALDLGRKILAELADIKRTIHDAIKIPHNKEIETNNGEDHTSSSQQQSSKPIVTEAESTPPVTSTKKADQKYNGLINWLTKWKVAMEYGGVAILAAYTVINYCMLRTSTGQLVVMQNQLFLQERPWLKISHTIIKPLTFDVTRQGGQMAIMTIQNIVENVGQTVALNVSTWEDVLPVDMASPTPALLRQAEVCESKRQGVITGYTVFPHDPFTEQQTVGPSMAEIAKVERHDNGMASFVLVGCVSYGSSLEPMNGRRHETQFMYFLGKSDVEGGMETLVNPHGVADRLVLFKAPLILAAD